MPVLSDFVNITNGNNNFYPRPWLSHLSASMTLTFTSYRHQGTSRYDRIERKKTNKKIWIILYFLNCHSSCSISSWCFTLIEKRTRKRKRIWTEIPYNETEDWTLTPVPWDSKQQDVVIPPYTELAR